MMFGIPFLTYNYKEAARKCTTAYMEIKQYLPYLTPEERNKKDLKRYGVLASKAIKSREVLEAIQEQEKQNDQAVVDHHMQNRAVIESSKQFISRENHQLLLKMGPALLRAKVNENGLVVESDWSYLTQIQILQTLNFWKFWSMVFLASTFFYFMRLNLGQYANFIHEDTAFLANVGFVSPFLGACAVMGSPFIMQVVGFQWTYMGLLVLQCFLSFTMSLVSGSSKVLTVWIFLCGMTEGSTYALILTVTGSIYGPE
jgi:hypothetical protein